MSTPPPSHDDSPLLDTDPREVWTPGDNDDEADDTARHVPWRFREGEGTQVIIGRVARRHPWAAAEQVTEETVPLTWRDRWAQSRASQQWQALQDRCVGAREARHRHRRHRPSHRAMAEWLAYYQGLYRGHEPDPDTYTRLLARNGVPDWANPYRPGDTDYYDYHPEGLLAADLEAILLGVQQDWTVAQDRDATVERHRQLARLCWAQVVVRTDSLAQISRHLHVANLRLATFDAALSPDLGLLGLTADQVRAGATTHGWQSRDPESLSLQRMITDLTDRL